jgi:hypothetical protein
MQPMHIYEVRPRKDKRGVDLVCDAPPFGGLFYSRSHQAVIRVYDDAGKMIQTHEHNGDFKDW